MTQTNTEKADLYQACGSGDILNAMSILAIHPDLLNSFSPVGMTPLCLACANGEDEMVDFLVRHGADINQASHDEKKLTPLQWAEYQHQEDIVFFLKRVNPG